MNPAAIGSPLPTGTFEKVRTAAQEFEAMAIGEMLKPMFDTVDQSKTLFGGGEGEAAWRSMLISAIAKQMAAHGGLGLARPVMQQLLSIQEKRDGAS